MSYTPQSWQDSTKTAPFGGISAERLNHIEAGLVAAAAEADAAAASAATALATANSAAAYSTAPSGAAPGNLVIVASDGSLTTEADYTDVNPSIAGSVLRGRISPTTAWVEEAFPHIAAQRGFIGWTHDPNINGSAGTPTTGTVILTRLGVYQSVATVAELHQYFIAAMGGTGSTTLARLGLYRRSGNTGTKFAQTADLSASVGTTGDKGGALTQVSSRNMALTAGETDVYAAAIYVFTNSVVATLMTAGGSAGAASTNAFLTLPEFSAASLAGQTDLPDTIDFTTVTTAGSVRFFGAK